MQSLNGDQNQFPMYAKRESYSLAIAGAIDDFKGLGITLDAVGLHLNKKDTSHDIRLENMEADLPGIWPRLAINLLRGVLMLNVWRKMTLILAHQSTIAEPRYRYLC